MLCCLWKIFAPSAQDMTLTQFGPGASSVVGCFLQDFSSESVLLQWLLLYLALGHEMHANEDEEEAKISPGLCASGTGTLNTLF